MKKYEMNQKMDAMLKMNRDYFINFKIDLLMQKIRN